MWGITRTKAHSTGALWLLVFSTRCGWIPRCEVWIQRAMLCVCVCVCEYIKHNSFMLLLYVSAADRGIQTGAHQHYSTDGCSDF